MTDALSLPVPWTEGVWRSELTSPLSLYLVADGGGEVIAQIGAKRILEELHITTLAVRPEHRRTGTGRSLLEAAVALCPEVKTVLLEVRERNTVARTFYEKLGFVRAGMRPRYYGDDEDAVVMTLVPRRPSR